MTDDGARDPSFEARKSAHLSVNAIAFIRG